MRNNAPKGTGPVAAGLAVLVAVVAVAVYGRTLDSGFVYDDKIQILLNPWITSAKYLANIFSTHSFGFSEKEYQAISYRPMVFVVYMVEYALFGLKPWGWHLVNVILHALNSVMVFFLTSLLLSRRPGGAGLEEPGRPDAPAPRPYLLPGLPAFAAGIIFAVHPINTEAVAWVGCIPELFYTLMMLSSFYLFVRSLDTAPYGGAGGFRLAVSVLLFFIAALTKETAVLLPLLFFIYDRTRGRDEKVLGAPVVKRYAPYLAAAVIYIAIRSYILGGEAIPTEKLHAYLTGGQFVLNSMVLLAKDLGFMILPMGSFPLQLLDPVYSVAEPRAILSIAALLAGLVFVIAMRKKLNPLVIFSVFLMVLPLLPTLYSPAISRTPYADRYMYFPSIGLVLILSLVFRRACAYGVKARSQAVLWGSVAVFVLIASVFSAWSSGKALFWKDDLTLWRSALRGDPENYLAIHSIGAIYFSDGRTGDAVKTLELALMLNETSLHPDPTAIMTTRKVLATAYGKKGMVDKAINEYNIILRAEPDHVVANYNLAVLYKDKGSFSDAIEFYDRALLFATKPWQFKDIFVNLAESYAGLGLWGEAALNYEKALKYAPGDAEILKDLISARRRSGALPLGVR
jgi:tetratricopeptide (TPR) repeat protein